MLVKSWRLLIVMLCGPILLAGSITTAALAQKVPTPVIAILDTDKVFQESKAWKTAVASVQLRAQKFEKEIYAERDSLKAKEDELRKQKSVLAKDELQRRVGELRRKQIDLGRKAEGMRARLNRSMQSAKAKLGKEIRKTLPEIQKRKKITIVIERSRVLVFDQNLDITKDVIAALNKRVTKINIDDPIRNN